MNLRKLFPLLFLFPIAISSQNFVVNSTLDSVDDSPGNGVCDDGAGNCTLRAAIEESNALAGTHQITFSVSGTITLGSMLPPLNTNINIQGPGTGSLTISGDNSTRIFYAKNGNIMVTNLTLANGLAMGGSGSSGGGGGMGAGGAILMHEGQTGTLNVQIMNVVFENNQATGGYGADDDGDDDVSSLGGGGGGLHGTGGSPVDDDEGGGGGGGFFGGGGDTDDDTGGGGGGFYNDGQDGDDGGDGGDGGGGGALDGSGGASTFIGETDGQDPEDDSDGGDGGFGGGGGGGIGDYDDDSSGGRGGFAGGGGGGGFADDDSQGGDGGFGGGGGAAGEADDDSDGGHGGFGGGGGSGEDDGGDSKFGGGDADNDDHGGGGMGAGGAIFVVSGSLALGDVTFSNNSTMYGEGGDSDNEGEGLGGAIFVYGRYLYDDPEDDGGPEIQDDAFYEVDGKLNATVGIKAGSDLTFINNSATDEDNDDALITDGETVNNNNDVFGPILNLAPIPTLGEWGILLLSLLLLTFGISTITKKEALLQGNKRAVGIEFSNMLPFIGFAEIKDNIIHLLAITTIIVMMVFLVWGKITLIDALGIPVISYLVLNLLRLIKKNS